MDLYYMIAAAALAGMSALTLCHLETRHFIIRRYVIASGRLPQSFDGVRLALITDLHSTEYGRGNKKLLAALETESPDYVLIAGDMLVAKPGADFTPAVSFLKEISSRYPVFYSFGNHECRLGEKKDYYGDMFRSYTEAIGRFPLTTLHNRSVRLEREGDAIDIYGLEIGKEYYRRFKHYQMTGNYLTGRLGKRDAEQFSVLIAHNPFYLPAYAQWGADLVVSGHNHGGIARLPFLGGLVDPNLRIFPKYDRGLFREDNTQMVLSGGTGSHSPNFRAFNPPELVMITLQQDKKGTLS